MQYRILKSNQSRVRCLNWKKTVKVKVETDKIIKLYDPYLIGSLYIKENWIYNLVVNPKYRNKGYASKILEYLFNYYKDRNVRYMLEVRIDNKIAIHLYEKHNFKIIKTRKKYYNGVDALIMERK